MHRSRPRILTTILIAAILPAIPVSCRAPSPEGPPAGTVRAVIPTEPATLCLIGKTDRYTEVIARQVTDSLVQYDTDLGFAPRLAESWDVSDDGLEVTFRLRGGVRWHDGEPFTADDVVFTVEKVREPATEARSFLAQFQDLVSLEATDDLTLVATYAKPYPDFLEAWTVPIAPRHQAGGDEDILNGAYAASPLGCGPFRFVSHEPGSRIVLEANDDYWDGRPSLDRLVFRIIGDERTAYQSLLAGDVEIMAVAPDLWRESGTAPRAAGLSRFIYHRLGVWYIAWNQRGNPFFPDARVRRAMIQALDRETFIEQVLDGLAIPGATTYHPDSFWGDPSVKPWPYDPAEAARLLEEAGWSDSDGDGVRDRDGRPFLFTLIFPLGSQEISDRMAAWTQQSLEEIGVRMEIEKLEWRAFLERRNGRNYEAAMAAFNFSPAPDLYELYHSSATEDGLNFFGLADPEVDRLVTLGRETFETVRRKEIYRALQARLHELEPIACLFHFSVPVLHRSELQGIRPSPIDYWRIWPGPRSWTWESGARPDE